MLDAKDLGREVKVPCVFHPGDLVLRKLSREERLGALDFPGEVMAAVLHPEKVLWVKKLKLPFKIWKEVVDELGDLFDLMTRRGEKQCLPPDAAERPTWKRARGPEETTE